MTKTTSLLGVTWTRYTSAVTGILSFVSSSVHFAWCTQKEHFQLHRMERLLSHIRDHPSPSYCVDVGMNDGFYTMLMAASGCVVNSFEIQPLCIDIAHVSLSRNGFQRNVTIHNRPVSAKHEQKLTFPLGTGCDGGYGMHGKIGHRMGHLKQVLRQNVSFYAFALDSLEHSGHDIKVPMSVRELPILV